MAITNVPAGSMLLGTGRFGNLAHPTGPESKRERERENQAPTVRSSDKLPACSLRWLLLSLIVSTFQPSSTTSPRRRHHQLQPFEYTHSPKCAQLRSRTALSPLSSPTLADCKYHASTTSAPLHFSRQHRPLSSLGSVRASWSQIPVVGFRQQVGRKKRTPAPGRIPF